MRKLLSLRIVMLSILLSQAAAFSQDEAAKPSYKNGDTWTYTVKEGGSVGSSSRSLNGTYEVSIADGKMKVAVVKGADKEELEPRPPALLALLTFTPNLDFPLTVGKQWTRDYKGTYVGSNKPIARKITYEVKGVEQVTTPAGTFRAFKLESDDRAGPRDYYTTTYWYSPDTRSIVKSKFDGSAGGQQTGLQREIELIKMAPTN
ncbi:MAG TPA: hypothetical protein VMT22_09315 [Terriglobales bacterium]|nr:hypothetical protein [Terriglobales bacterium]